MCVLVPSCFLALLKLAFGQVLMPTRQEETNARRFIAGALSGAPLPCCSIVCLLRPIRRYLRFLYLPPGRHSSPHGVRNQTSCCQWPANTPFILRYGLPNVRRRRSQPSAIQHFQSPASAQVLPRLHSHGGWDDSLRRCILPQLGFPEILLPAAQQNRPQTSNTHG